MPHTVSCCGASADEDDPKLAVKEAKETKGKGKSTGFVPSSARFISFDADDPTEKKKRKAAGIEEETAKSKMAGKSKVVKEESDEEKGEPSSPNAKPSKGKRAGGKKK